MCRCRRCPERVSGDSFPAPLPKSRPPVIKASGSSKGCLFVSVAFKTTIATFPAPDQRRNTH
uniref:Uncharacterized protein n=1 Tax=Neogobius melanostomus TaxID=47308 RepID=A0A8C6V5G6_9GOBI